MPLFDYKCLDCGKISEILVYHEKDEPACKRMRRPSDEKNAVSPFFLVRVT